MQKFQVSFIGLSTLFGRTSSLLLKQSPFIKCIKLYDETTIDPALDIAVLNTTCKVKAFLGKSQLKSALKDADIIVIGEDCSVGNIDADLFKEAAPKVLDYAKAIASTAPKAIIVVAASPLNSLVPLVTQMLSYHGCYNANKVLGATSADNVRANALLASHLKMDARKVVLPVIGGCSEKTRIPIFSQAKPNASLSLETQKELTRNIQLADYHIKKIKNQSESLNKAYATMRLLNSIMAGLRGEANVTDITMTNTNVIKGVEFFSLPVVFGRDGIKERIGLPALSEVEGKMIDSSINHLNSDVAKAISFFREASALASCSFVKKDDTADKKNKENSQSPTFIYDEPLKDPFKNPERIEYPVIKSIFKKQKESDWKPDPPEPVMKRPSVSKGCLSICKPLQCPVDPTLLQQFDPTVHAPLLREPKTTPHKLSDKPSSIIPINKEAISINENVAPNHKLTFREIEALTIKNKAELKLKIRESKRKGAGPKSGNNLVKTINIKDGTVSAAVDCSKPIGMWKSNKKLLSNTRVSNAKMADFVRESRAKLEESIISNNKYVRKMKIEHKSAQSSRIKCKNIPVANEKKSFDEYKSMMIRHPNQINEKSFLPYARQAKLYKREGKYTNQSPDIKRNKFDTDPILENPHEKNNIKRCSQTEIKADPTVMEWEAAGKNLINDLKKSTEQKITSANMKLDVKDMKPPTPSTSPIQDELKTEDKHVSHSDYMAELELPLKEYIKEKPVFSNSVNESRNSRSSNQLEEMYETNVQRVISPLSLAESCRLPNIQKIVVEQSQSETSKGEEKIAKTKSAGTNLPSRINKIVTPAHVPTVVHVDRKAEEDIKKIATPDQVPSMVHHDCTLEVRSHSTDQTKQKSVNISQQDESNENAIKLVTMEDVKSYMNDRMKIEQRGLTQKYRLKENKKAGKNLEQFTDGQDGLKCTEANTTENNSTGQQILRNTPINQNNMNVAHEITKLDQLEVSSKLKIETSKPPMKQATKQNDEKLVQESLPSFSIPSGKTDSRANKSSRRKICRNEEEIPSISKQSIPLLNEQAIDKNNKEIQVTKAFKMSTKVKPQTLPAILNRANNGQKLPSNVMSSSFKRKTSGDLVPISNSSYTQESHPRISAPSDKADSRVNNTGRGKICENAEETSSISEQSIPLLNKQAVDHTYKVRKKEPKQFYCDSSKIITKPQTAPEPKLDVNLSNDNSMSVPALEDKTLIAEPQISCESSSNDSAYPTEKAKENVEQCQNIRKLSIPLIGKQSIHSQRGKSLSRNFDRVDKEEIGIYPVQRANLNLKNRAANRIQNILISSPKNISKNKNFNSSLMQKLTLFKAKPNSETSAAPDNHGDSVTSSNQEFSMAKVNRRESKTRQTSETVVTSTNFKHSPQDYCGHPKPKSLLHLISLNQKPHNNSNDIEKVNSYPKEPKQMKIIVNDTPTECTSEVIIKPQNELKEVEKPVKKLTIEDIKLMAHKTIEPSNNTEPLSPMLNVRTVPDQKGKNVKHKASIQPPSNQKQRSINTSTYTPSSRPDRNVFLKNKTMSLNQKDTTKITPLEHLRLHAKPSPKALDGKPRPLVELSSFEKYSMRQNTPKLPSIDLKFRKSALGSFKRKGVSSSPEGSRNSSTRPYNLPNPKFSYTRGVNKIKSEDKKEMKNIIDSYLERKSFRQERSRLPNPNNNRRKHEQSLPPVSHSVPLKPKQLKIKKNKKVRHSLLQMLDKQREHEQIATENILDTHPPLMQIGHSKESGEPEFLKRESRNPSMDSCHPLSTGTRADHIKSLLTSPFVSTNKQRTTDLRFLSSNSNIPSLARFPAIRDPFPDASKVGFIPSLKSLEEALTSPKM